MLESGVVFSSLLTRKNGLQVAIGAAASAAASSCRDDCCDDRCCDPHCERRRRRQLRRHDRHCQSAPVVVVAPPTAQCYQPIAKKPRPRWQPDSEAKVCPLPHCGKEFGFFESRHHCRRCGLVVCGTCSRASMMLPELEYFEHVRVCDRCVAEMREAPPMQPVAMPGPPPFLGTAGPHQYAQQPAPYGGQVPFGQPQYGAPPPQHYGSPQYAQPAPYGQAPLYGQAAYPPAYGAPGYHNPPSAPAAMHYAAPPPAPAHYDSTPSAPPMGL